MTHDHTPSADEPSPAPDAQPADPTDDARRTRAIVLGRGSWPEAKRIGELLRTETIGGMLLLGAAVLALILANSPWHESYFDLSHLHFGYAPWNLDLSVHAWAADGLLAIFFFVVGLELKHEFTRGDLRDLRTASVPIVAAAAGVAVPALVYLAVTKLEGIATASHGWGIVTATDIAFALAVLAVVGTHLPSALRSFLLTLAVVDDLIAITIIAIFYSSSFDYLPLLASIGVIAVFAALAHRGVDSWWLLIPLALAAWALMHASGIHATIAGVLLGFAVPSSKCHAWEHRWRPLSAGVAVPIFAFFAAGVRFADQPLIDTVRQPLVIAVATGLVLGKVIGISSGTWAMTRFTKARLDPSLDWLDVIGIALLGGIGFTVSLLVAELAFAGKDEFIAEAKFGVILGSLLAALLAVILLRRRNRHFRAIELEETRDRDADGIPDAWDPDARPDRVITQDAPPTDR